MLQWRCGKGRDKKRDGDVRHQERVRSAGGERRTKKKRKRGSEGETGEKVWSVFRWYKLETNEVHKHDFAEDRKRDRTTAVTKVFRKSCEGLADAVGYLRRRSRAFS